jgi:hypothetical protein
MSTKFASQAKRIAAAAIATLLVTAVTVGQAAAGIGTSMVGM